MYFEFNIQLTYGFFAPSDATAGFRRFGGVWVKSCLPHSVVNWRERQGEFKKTQVGLIVPQVDFLKIIKQLDKNQYFCCLIWQ